MAKANWFYNSRDKKWEIRDRFGVNVFEIADGGAIKVKGALTGVTDITVATLSSMQAANVAGVASLADTRIERVKVGGGATLSFLTKLTGTLGGLAAVGTNTVAVATITGMTVTPGDMVFGTPKVALAGGIGIVGYFVAATNTVNAYVVNPSIASAGSLPHTGIDVTILRLAG